MAAASGRCGGWCCCWNQGPGFSAALPVPAAERLRAGGQTGRRRTAASNGRAKRHPGPPNGLEVITQFPGACCNCDSSRCTPSGLLFAPPPAPLDTAQLLRCERNPMPCVPDRDDGSQDSRSIGRGGRCGPCRDSPGPASRPKAGPAAAPPRQLHQRHHGYHRTATSAKGVQGLVGTAAASAAAASAGTAAALAACLWSPPPTCPTHNFHYQIKVALCQLAVSDDKQRNLATARSAIDEAAGAGGWVGGFSRALPAAASSVLQVCCPPLETRHRGVATACASVRHRLPTCLTRCSRPPLHSTTLPTTSAGVPLVLSLLQLTIPHCSLFFLPRYLCRRRPSGAARNVELPLL